jgi:hypothetical protein
MEIRAKLVGVAAAFVLALLLASPANAGVFLQPTLDFGIVAPTAGSISYAGGAAPLVGTNIEVDNVVGLDTPANNNLLVVCDTCGLNFTTGNFVSSTATTWTFGPGGSITIVGGVDLTGNGNAGDAGDIPVGTTLLSGTFIENPVVTLIGGTFRIAGAVFVDTKDDRLVEFYGLPSGVEYSGGFNISFEATGSPPNAFSSRRVLSGDITNSPKVSIPSSMLLIGSGLIGFVYLHLRHRRS